MQFNEYDYRGFTVYRLEQLVNGCLERARELDVELLKKGSGSRCFGIIKINGKVFFWCEYANRFDFMNTAQMFVDFAFIMEGLSRDRATGNGIEECDPYGWLKWWYEKKGLIKTVYPEPEGESSHQQARQLAGAGN